MISINSVEFFPAHMDLAQQKGTQGLASQIQTSKAASQARSSRAFVTEETGDYREGHQLFQVLSLKRRPTACAAIVSLLW